MIRTIAWRLAQSVPTLLGVSIGVFLIVRMTGDPAAVLLPPDSPPEVIAEFRRTHGLDQPLYMQYLNFMQQLLAGDLGRSIRYQESVFILLADRLPNTLTLAFLAIGASLLLGVLLGSLGAKYKDKWPDSAVRSVAVLGQAVPTFYLGILLILLFGVILPIFPTFGAGTPMHLVLPVLTLTLFLVPTVIRVTRGSLLEEMNQDYARTARSKGLSENSILFVHVLKPSLIPVITVVGLQLGGALGGAIVTETVFAWPGLGQLLMSAISNRDFPVIQGVVLFSALAFVAVNLIVDIVYQLVDPRIEKS